MKLRTIQGRLTTKGEFTATISNKQHTVEATIVVITGHMQSAPLLGKDTLIQLGMLKLDGQGSLKEKQVMKIQGENYDDLINKYKVFEGIGVIHDKINNRELYAKLNMKEGATPVAQKARPVAYYLQKPLKDWLDQCVEEGIYERVPEEEPISWCSPLVVQPKPRFKNEKNFTAQMIRASIDLRIPNKHMERNRIVQNPIVEDFTHKFHDCTIFSKMDMRQGYHQLLLHPDSRSIATFGTPWGNLRPRRLVFGAKSSQDSFDDVMQRIFGDIPYCLNQRDDILIGGKNREEHDKTLEIVLKRAEDYGITFSREKCQFGVKSIEFYGYKFTENGLMPTKEKVKAVKECREPESKSAVRSFLGMIGYLAKFIPSYSTVTAPLQALTHKDVRFKWGKEENEAFQKLKDAITDDKTMAYFNPRLPIVLRTEASFQ